MLQQDSCHKRSHIVIAHEAYAVAIGDGRGGAGRASRPRPSRSAAVNLIVLGRWSDGAEWKMKKKNTSAP
ncbi:hypothetical protein EVAR_66020_1 [Eumeta japonica]|uniref:Uncharacterized protein n=1 Tax=Eumeta variegata TaxID=151549 RepID=A0A4C1Z850_EUMVA|nr:hypothetical protein EVAR_66020_1 [Eumeta japonica]